MLIKSYKRLCEEYGTISKLAHETGDPIYITQDGDGDLVVMSIEAFEKRDEAIRRQIERQLTETQPLAERKNTTPADTTTMNHTGERSGTMPEYTEYSLGQILKGMYDSAPRGDQVAYIHLFGIKFAEILTNARISKSEILKSAGLPESYQTEISKGVKLAKYVNIKEQYV